MTRLGLGLAAALALSACARSIDMSVASLHQRPAEFDFLVYQDGWACLSKATPGRDAAGDACGSRSGRQLRELFSQRSSARPLRDYLTENGASCRPSGNAVTCSYVKTLNETPLLRAAPSGEDAFELTVSFPAKDRDLAPEQIATALRRYVRAS